LAELNQKTIPKYWITDPVNTFYGADLSEPLVDLQASKVNLVLVNIHKLRANNLLFAPFWLLIFQFFPKKNPGILPHPLKPKRKSGLRPFFEAVNAKANHRKVFLGDDKVIVGSANLHDASSFYANTALEVQSLEVAQHFFTSEKAVAKISGLNIPVPDLFSNNSKPAALKNGDHVAVTPLLGKQILASILEDLRSTQKGDQIFIAMLFIAHRKVIKELKKATKRGVVVKVVLDSNQHSFGENKIGMPNQFVARELVKSKIAVYFYQTGDWEFHSKLIFIIKNSTAIINTGSANLTRRSLSATNLEANLRVEGNLNLPIFQEVQEYFDQKLKKPLAQKQETAKSYHFSFFYWLYRFEEATGLATF
jgi:phosphatidylserine/phosphatidylglycerophosphate/cardiolipin synthase-like enzyme